MSSETPPLPASVAVIGAGTMGVGIATSFAAAGCSVAVAARRASSLDAAAERARAIAPDDATLARLSYTTSTEEALAGADLVVETVAEHVASKREVLALAERVAAPDAILTTNTSSIPLSAIAPALARAERFAGLHWLNPPELVELVEVVASEHTEPSILETLARWMDELGKAPVIVRRDLPGFLANRLQYALLREAWALVEDGVCSHEDVDRVLTRGLGVRWSAIGPFEAMDLGGLDIFLTVGRNLLPELGCIKEPPPWFARIVEGGALGCKNGRGLYGDYGPEDVERLVERRTRVQRGIAGLRDGKESP